MPFGPVVPPLTTGSHPSRVRGLKSGLRDGPGDTPLSHPSRVRGLKYEVPERQRLHLRSHPSRVRGLKLCLVYRTDSGCLVAPFTGAWIEMILRSFAKGATKMSHPSRVRGLKYADRGRSGGRGWSHPSRVRGLK